MAASQLIPTYRKIIETGEIPASLRGTCIPDVQAAQQQFVRYPYEAEARECADGWQRRLDKFAETLGPWGSARMPDYISLTVERAPLGWVLPVKKEQVLNPSFRVAIEVKAKQHVTMSIGVTPFILTEDELSQVAAWKPPATPSASAKAPCSFLNQAETITNQFELQGSQFAFASSRNVYDFNFMVFDRPSGLKMAYILFHASLPTGAYVYTILSLPTVCICRGDQRAKATGHIARQLPLLMTLLRHLADQAHLAQAQRQSATAQVRGMQPSSNPLEAVRQALIQYQSTSTDAMATLMQQILHQASSSQTPSSPLPMPSPQRQPLPLAPACQPPLLVSAAMSPRPTPTVRDLTPTTRSSPVPFVSRPAGSMPLSPLVSPRQKRERPGPDITELLRAVQRQHAAPDATRLAAPRPQPTLPQPTLPQLSLPQRSLPRSGALLEQLTAGLDPMALPPGMLQSIGSVAAPDTDQPFNVSRLLASGAGVLGSRGPESGLDLGFSTQEPIAPAIAGPRLPGSGAPAPWHEPNLAWGFNAFRAQQMGLPEPPCPAHLFGRPLEPPLQGHAEPPQSGPFTGLQ